MPLPHVLPFILAMSPHPRPPALAVTSGTPGVTALYTVPPISASLSVTGGIAARGQQQAPGAQRAGAGASSK
jgi:hypothetical protein